MTEIHAAQLVRQGQDLLAHLLCTACLNNIDDILLGMLFLERIIVFERTRRDTVAMIGRCCMARAGETVSYGSIQFDAAREKDCNGCHGKKQHDSESDQAVLPLFEPADQYLNGG